MDEFVLRRNIAHYKALLEVEKEAATRRALQQQIKAWRREEVSSAAAQFTGT